MAGEARVLDYADEDAALAACHDYEWTDGLPVVLPTVARVDAMLAALGDPATVVAAMPPNGFAVTNRALAANAVMAVCLPEHLPVLEVLERAVCAPEYNLNGIATTTGPSTPFAVVSGPAAARAGLNHGRGALGPGSAGQRQHRPGAAPADRQRRPGPARRGVQVDHGAAWPLHDVRRRERGGVPPGSRCT